MFFVIFFVVAVFSNDISNLFLNFFAPMFYINVSLMFCLHFLIYATLAFILPEIIMKICEVSKSI